MHNVSGSTLLLPSSREPLSIRPVASVACTTCQLLRCRSYPALEAHKSPAVCSPGQLPRLAATWWCCHKIMLSSPSAVACCLSFVDTSGAKPWPMAGLRSH